jgi:uncharacterized repeat protein (TIGR01451 family)
LLTALVLVTASPASASTLTPSGTAISNFATVSYKDANGNPMPTVNSNTVTTTVSQVGGTDVTPPTAAGSGVVGGTVNYAATVTNTGNGTDAYTLATSGLPPGWTATIYVDANGNGVLDPGETTVAASTGNLLMDGTFQVIIQVTVPAGASANDTGAVTLTATSGFNNTLTDTGVFTTTVLTANVTMVKTASPSNPQPGDTVTYTIQYQNTGNDMAYNAVIKDAIPSGANYVSNSLLAGATAGSATVRSDLADGDNADFNATTAGSVTHTLGSVAAGASGVLIFRVTIGNLTEGTAVSNIAQTFYETPLGTARGPFDSPASIVTVSAEAALTLGTSGSRTGDPSDTVVYPLTVTNSGNSDDVIDLLPSSTAGSTVTFYLDLNNDGVIDPGEPALTDTDGDGAPDTGSIPPGTIVHIIAAVTIPAGTPDGTIDVTTVVARSTDDTGVSSTVTLTTTVTAPLMTVVKTVAPLGNQPPGTVLTYTVVYTNTGTGAATEVVLDDQIPAHTAYVPSSMTLDGNALTDPDDADPGECSGAAVVIVHLGLMGPSATHTVTFQVRIN